MRVFKHRSSAGITANGGGRRTRRRIETGQRLLEAAKRLFARQGFATTTVESITEAADVGKGTFFNYFPSKEHVFVALIEKQVGKLAAAAGAIDPQAPIREQVRRVAHQVAGEWQHSQRLIRTIVGTLLSNEALTPGLQVLLAQGRGHMVVLIREGQRRGELRQDIPAADLIRMVQQLMFGTQVIWSLYPATGRRTPDLLAWVDQALDAFWRGIEAVPSPRPRSAARQRQ
ncbi:MAG: TetR/AcrR family transcriptional regulator [Chromatiales bacterium]